MSDLADLLIGLRNDLSQVTTLHELDQVKSRYLGQNSLIREQLVSLGRLPKEERAQAGKSINNLKSQVENAVANHKSVLIERQEAEKLEKEAVDTSRFLIHSRQGALHPLTKIKKRLQTILESLGFHMVEGDEIETAYYNFTALNTPDYHPATTVQDTFYLQDVDYLLRSHTSCVQVRTMEKNEPPLRIFSPGRVFRADTPDATHSPCFAQCEGLVIDKKSTIRDLEATLRILLESFFERPLTMRFRPSYFPFTEPSFECDIAFKDKWLEILGCGMVHPNVLDNVGIDSSEWQGFAFGLGIDRLCMLYYGIDDIRLLYESDVRFLSQFRDD